MMPEAVSVPAAEIAARFMSYVLPVYMIPSTDVDSSPHPSPPGRSPGGSRAVPFCDLATRFEPGTKSWRRVFVIYHLSDLPLDPAFRSGIEKSYPEVVYIRYVPPVVMHSLMWPVVSFIAYCDRVVILTGARMLMPDATARYCRSLTGCQHDS